ncbi:SMP-30/gluconolactonase/LRE family protein [Epibacterium ulvae]|uniref:SMP-30/gluconolactonase/LRE family protein n=1 Tax=Epibacterium ulvae TaxID=1156985 RepID=UPI001BFC1F39|nr:SMP-30/gluconolactonase/LRE family protein [Epibacterium ulvae]MBT8155659.1 SMP-30/gluconolactonase/LRE family protein [Epibacterium ulvae]
MTPSTSNPAKSLRATRPTRTLFSTLSSFALVATLGVFSSTNANALDTNAPQVPSELFASLPDTCPTPDAFAITPEGNLTLSCPNYAGSAGQQQGALLGLTPDGTPFDIGTLSQFTQDGKTRPMGMAYAPDGALFIADNRGGNDGRVLRVTFEDGKIATTEVVASGLSSPNGLRYHNGGIYITQLRLPNVAGPHIASGIYRFNETDRDLVVPSDGTSETLIFLDHTTNPNVGFGLDGLVFDAQGHLYTANLGDGIVYKLSLDAKGKVISQQVHTTVPTTVGPDGMSIDDKGNLYLAGLRSNQIIKVDPQGKTSVLTENGDSDGANGELDQPADLIVYNGKLIVSNFDLMKGDGIVNQGHSKPYTLSTIDLN